jgi:probable rRNA maturation factor
VNVEVIVRVGVPELLPESDCVRVLQAALEAAGAPVGATVTLTLSDNAELAELNQAHMGKTGPTDVLSFPLVPASAFPAHPGQDPALRETGPDFPLPPGAVPHLGDIIVSVERASEQAQAGAGGQTSDVSWAAADELRLLITHGGLHLCGWDHAEPEEEAAMRALERRLLGLDAETVGLL